MPRDAVALADTCVVARRPVTSIVPGSSTTSRRRQRAARAAIARRSRRRSRASGGERTRGGRRASSALGAVAQHVLRPAARRSAAAASRGRPATPASRRGRAARGRSRRSPRAASTSDRERRAGSHGTNGSPGRLGTSRPASQRSTEAPTSANGPSWRRPPWPAKRASSGTCSRVWSVPGERGVDAVVGGEDQQVALGVEVLEPLPHRRVDLLQRAVEARDVVAVAEDLVGLDEVGEHEAAVELASISSPVAAIAAALVEPLCCSSTPTPLNTCPILPTVCTGTPGGLQLLQVRAARRVERDVARAPRCARTPPARRGTAARSRGRRRARRS